MKSLRNIAMVMPLASVMIFAQAQNTPGRSADQADKTPAASDQADRPAGQAGQAGQAQSPAAQPSTQTDRPAGQAGAGQAGQSTTPGASSTQTEKSSQSQSSSQSTTQSSTQADRSSATMAGSPRTYTGTVVNATCSQATALTNAPGSYSASADRTSTASSSSTSKSNDANASSTTKDDKSTDTSSTHTTVSNKNQKSVYDLQRDVIRHCAVGKDTTSFALVTDDGQFLKLDDAGNTQVKSSAGKSAKNMKVSVSGAAEGDTLKVQTLTRTDAKQ